MNDASDPFRETSDPPASPSDMPAGHPILGYRPPAEDAIRISPARVCFIALGVGAMVWATVLGAIVFAFATETAWPFLMIPALLAGLIALAVRCHRRRRRAAVFGICIGMGVGLLAQGLCFGIGFVV